MISKPNSNLLYLIEALKVEGYWSIKNRQGSIQNKDIMFLKYIESILKENGIKVKKRILVKIKTGKSHHIKIYDKYGNKIKFRYETSPFIKKKSKISFNLPFKPKQEIKLFLDNIKTLIKIEIKDYELEVRSKVITGWAYLDLRFYDINFIRFLESIGNKKKLSINFNTIKNKQDAMAIFSAIVDAEANLAHYKFFRRISIRMKTESYIKDIHKLLNSIGVDSSVSKIKNKPLGYDFFSLIVEGWEDFNKLVKAGVDLKHSKKKKKLKEILGSYKRNQVSRYSAEDFYLDFIKKKPGLSIRELIGKTSKGGRVINHYLKKLINKKLLYRIRKQGVNEITYLYYPNNSKKF